MIIIMIFVYIKTCYICYKTYKESCVSCQQVENIHMFINQNFYEQVWSCQTVSSAHITTLTLHHNFSSAQHEREGFYQINILYAIYFYFLYLYSLKENLFISKSILSFLLLVINTLK